MTRRAMSAESHERKGEGEAALEPVAEILLALDRRRTNSAMGCALGLRHAARPERHRDCRVDFVKVLGGVGRGS